MDTYHQRQMLQVIRSWHESLLNPDVPREAIAEGVKIAAENLEKWIDREEKRMEEFSEAIRGGRINEYLLQNLRRTG